MRTAPFIWIKEQIHDHSYTFRKLVSQGPSKRDDGQNRWYLFRLTFNLKEDLESALTKITVDGRYQLFVNEKQVCRGPIRCNPEFQRYDQIDLKPFLRMGENVIGMLVHVYGKDTAWYQQSLDYWQSLFGDGMVYFDSTLQYKNHSTPLISNSDWRYINAESWDRETPLSGWGQDFIEKFDANKFPSKWLQKNFDDSLWKNAVELEFKTSENEKKMGWANIHPFPILIKNTLPFLTQKKISAVEIIQTFQVTPDPKSSFEERIFCEKFEPLLQKNNAISDMQNILVDDISTAIITTNTQYDIAVVLSFDGLETGFPFIDIIAKGGEIIDIAVSETLPGEYTENGIQTNRIKIGSHLDCRHMFQYKARKGTQRFEKFEWTAVRYMVVVVRNAPEGLDIRHLGVNAAEYPLEYKGAFNCSDPLLNNLWQTGANTIFKCSHDAWEDCPSREKRQWIGDGFVRYPASLVCFGNSGIELDKLYLQQAAESQRNDGLLQMFAPGDHHYNGIVIPDFSLHWISCLHHFLWFTNDEDTVSEHFSSLEKIIKWYCLQLNDQGMLSDLPHWQFIEWADIERQNQATTINAMFAGALQQAAFIASHIGYEKIAEKYLKIRDIIKNVLNTKHWDPIRKVYVDSINQETDKMSRQVSQHANVQMIVHDLAPHKRWNSMMEYITDHKRVKLTATPPVVNSGEILNPETDVVKCNTSFAHFLYTALAKTDRFQQALESFRNNYGPMLATGTPTIWESFAPDASLCHAFSTSPVYHLSKEILGIQAKNPGFSKIIIQPKTCDLNFANGCYPTIRGDILIAWYKTEDSLTIEIDLPEFIEALLVIDANYTVEKTPIKLVSGKQSMSFKSTN